MQFLEGRQYWEHGHNKQALRLFTTVVQSHPAADEAEYAANIILNLLSERRNREESLRAVKAMLATAPLVANRHELKERLEVVLQALRAQEAKERLKRGDFARCAALFLDIYKQRPKSLRGAPALLYNAAICQDKSGQRRRAAATLRRLLKRHPDATAAKLATKRLTEWGY